MDAIASGRLAVITGAASGIGRAVARRLSLAGMKVCLLDSQPSVLDAAQLIGGEAEGFVVDVRERASLQMLALNLEQQFGPAAVLMNNAGIHGGADALGDAEIWDRVIGVNLLGVLNGVQAFVPGMIAGNQPGLIINTGSKQGITQPPGNTAYNVSKAGVKALTEGLAHTLRERTGPRVRAHLLIPGFTFTGMTRAAEKPPAAWSPEQVADFLFERLAAGDFYVLCPDNEVGRDTDEKRMAWAIGDLIENRPALSRWHPDFKARFEAFMARPRRPDAS